MLSQPKHVFAEDGTSTTLTMDWIPPKEVRGNYFGHWRPKADAARKVRQSAIEHLLAELPEFTHYTRKGLITFQFHHWRKIDIDNLAIGMKPFVDGLVDSEMFIDDDPDHVVYGEHRFALCKKGESKTVVTIEELAP